MRILIVDDDPATVEFMRLAFAATGDTVDTASCVAEAMGHIAVQIPDVVLSDLTFGRDGDSGDDGFTLLRSLRSDGQTAHVGVLAVSGDDAPASLRAAEELGFDGFVSKPVDVASLIDRVHRLGQAATGRAGQSDVDRA